MASGDRNVVLTQLGTQGTSEVLAYAAKTPIIVCATDDPLRGVPGGMSQRTDMLDPQHEAIIADARKLWGWPVFPGLVYHTPVEHGPDEYAPQFITMIEASPAASSLHDLQIQFMPRDDGVTPQLKMVQVCTTKVKHQGVFEGATNANDTYGDHVVVMSTEACTVQTVCPKDQWWDTDELLKVCLRPTLKAKIGSEEYPTADDLAAGHDAFTKQFQEAFPQAHANAVARSGDRSVEFIGIDGRWTSGPPISMVRYRIGQNYRTGMSRASRDITASGYLQRHGHAQRYIDIVELYGNHEGGWYALQTYDGPKASFGWAQLTFGPNPSRGTTITEGYGKNFLSFLYARYADCFHRLFGAYGFRVSYADAAERDAWTSDESMAPRYSASTYAKTFIWRLPCCWRWGTNALPTSNVYTPPVELKLTRVQTASVGFAGLLAQAIIDPTFERAMAQWIVGMIDLAASQAGSNPTKAAVVRRLFLAIRGTALENELGSGFYGGEINRAIQSPLGAQPWNGPASTAPLAVPRPVPRPTRP
ncbi:hypothetical protein [Paraliomyxa miuraensis]|uniref:hypothetical protein n=1 Tax=Paraliomyxa miuraensis TaxID=376150 RepID=UPI00225AC88A|nr:hypothetical protein [Paraliomyxa miuraensis]MCX4241903.1 hypothetical protein [Paraliomyxa miuraensis]